MKIRDPKLEFTSLSERPYTDMIVIHHTGERDIDASAEQIHDWHLNQGWAGIGYHFVIRKDGTIEIGRPEWAVGSHAYGENSHTLGIHLSGDFETAYPSQAQLTACAELVRDLCKDYGISCDREHIVGHCDLMSTDCPGKNLYAKLQTIIDAANGLANPATNTLAKLKAVIAAGNATQYVSAGDYFDITIPTAVNMYRGGTFPPTEEMIAAGYSVYHAQNEVIAANSTWRVVCLGVNHNPSIEGNNRVHFMIGRNTDNVNICFDGYFMTSDGSSTGGWNGSEMKTWLNGTFFNALPADLRNVITACTKYTDNIGLSSGTEDAVTATSDKIWIPAAFEIFGFCEENFHPSSTWGANPYEENKQEQYDYYKNGNLPIRFFSDTLLDRYAWWLRSPLDTNGDNHVLGTLMFCDATGCSWNTPVPEDVAGKLSSRETNADNTGNSFVPCFTIS